MSGLIPSGRTNSRPCTLKATAPKVEVAAAAPAKMAPPTRKPSLGA